MAESDADHYETAWAKEAGYALCATLCPKRFAPTGRSWPLAGPTALRAVALPPPSGSPLRLWLISPTGQEQIFKE